jgi:hypothetical protein
LPCSGRLNAKEWLKILKPEYWAVTPVISHMELAIEGHSENCFETLSLDRKQCSLVTELLGVRFEVFTEVTMKKVVFGYVTPCC